VAVAALLLAAPFERRRVCDVCPVDCPMHSTERPARHLGCHHASGAAGEAPRPVADGACAMRATCGHHGGAVVVFHAELPPAVIVATAAHIPLVARPASPVHVVDSAAPPVPPPERSVV
jgi:hypothetical protein